MMLYLGVPCFHGYSVNEVLLSVAANKTKVYEMFKYVSAEWQELQCATCSAQMCFLLFLFHTTSSSTVLPPLQLSSLPSPSLSIPFPSPPLSPAQWVHLPPGSGGVLQRRGPSTLPHWTQHTVVSASLRREAAPA